MNTPLRILVVGATGMLGRPVALRLKDDGAQVRVLARDAQRAGGLLGAGFDIVTGDATDAAAVDRALDGMDAVHINLQGGNTIEACFRNEAGGVKTIAGRVRAMGISKVGYVGGAGHEDQPGLLPELKRIGYRALRESGVDHLILKPTHFMETLPFFVRDGRAAVPGRQPNPYHYLAAADYARMVSAAFRDPTVANRDLTFFGPEPYTMVEALKIYCEHCAPSLTPGETPLWLLRVIAAARRDADLKFVTRLFKGFQTLEEAGDAAGTNALLGAPTKTLRAWCREHCEAE